MVGSYCTSHCQLLDIEKSQGQQTLVKVKSKVESPIRWGPEDIRPPLSEPLCPALAGSSLPTPIFRQFLEV
jgi:hypothetical protein